MALSLAVYLYHHTTYRILSPVPTCLVVFSTECSGVFLPCLAFLALVVSTSHCADRRLDLEVRLTLLSCTTIIGETQMLRVWCLCCAVSPKDVFNATFVDNT